MTSGIFQGVGDYLRKLSKRSSLRKITLGLLAYLLILALYMQPVLSNGCDQTYLGGPGDQSAFAWLYEASPNSSPLWGNTTWTNAPFGENVSEPFYITGFAQYASVWLMAKVMSPTCAFNVYASFGFFFTATIMFMFVLWLIRGRSHFAAWFAGYLVAFNPYLQVKTLYHVSYVYAGLLVALLWVFLLYWRKPTLRVAAIIMGILALFFYHDPYFIMLAFFLCIAIAVGTFIYHLFYNRISKQEIMQKIKPLLLALPIFILLIAPVVYTRFAYSQHIEAVVGNSRDADIMTEGRAYGARPWEFVIPAVNNPLTPESVKDFQLSRQHGASVTENTLFIGYVPMVLAGLYAIIWFRKHRTGKSKITPREQHVTLIAGGTTILSALMALPPYLHIGSLTVYFPSWLLLSLTTMWRVPARFFVTLQIGIAILAALGLLYLLVRYGKYLKKWQLYIAYGALLAISMVEYATFNPFNRQYWSHSMVPAVYHEVKANPSIDSIAEYPLLDPPRNGSFIFYLSYQAYHEKPMINTAKTSSPTKKYRESMADIYDWQTPGALKQLGVDKLIFHGEGSSEVSSPSFVSKKVSYDNQIKNSVTSFSIAKHVVAKPYLLAIGDGFDGPSNYGYKDIDYFMHQYGILRPVLLPGAEKMGSATAKVEFYAFERNPRSVKFTQEGKVLASVRATESKQVIEFSFDPAKQIKILPDNPPDDYSFVISNMEVK